MAIKKSNKTPGIEIKKNVKGEIIGYKMRCCVGRDNHYKQVWKTATISADDPRIDGKTPLARDKALNAIKAEWDEAQKTAFKKGQSNTDKDKISFKVFVDDHWWKDHVQDGEHTPSTIAFFHYMSKDIVSYFGEKKRLNQIDTEDVKRYIGYLKKDARTRSGEPYSQSTIQHHYRTLVNILDYARRMHYIETNPCADLSTKEKPRKDKQKIDFLDSQQARDFLKHLEGEPLFWKCFINLLIVTGLRRGEAVGLQWGDISPDGLTITVQRNVTMDKDSPDKLHIGKTKGKEERKVPISRRMYALLNELKEDQRKRYGTTLPNAFIFNRPNDPYKPINPTEPTRWQRRFVRRHELVNVSPHDLRHTAATLALEGGADLKQVQELLGHKDPQTTMAFYAGVSEAQQRRTVEGIENMIG